MGNLFSRLGTFLASEWNKVIGAASNAGATVALVATDVETAVEKEATIAVGVVNAAKGFIASPAGQTLEGLISLVPGVGPYLTDVLNLLPTVVTDANWAKAEFTKSPEQVVIDGFTAAVGVSTTQKVINLTGAAVQVGTLISKLSGTAASPQAFMSVIPAIYAVPPVIGASTQNGGSGIPNAPAS
jgi:hypothetical protein